MSHITTWEFARRSILTIAFVFAATILVSSTDITASEYARYAVSFGAWLCVLEILIFLPSYVRKIGPLRKFLNAHNSAFLVAPPYKWTLQYHLTFAWILFWIGVSTQYAIHQGAPLNPFVIAILPGVMWSVVVINHFLKYYVKDLQDAEQTIHDLEGEIARLRARGLSDL